MHSTSLLIVVALFGILFVGDAAQMRCRCRKFPRSKTSAATTTTEAPEEPQYDSESSTSKSPSSRKRCCCGGASGMNSTTKTSTAGNFPKTTTMKKSTTSETATTAPMSSTTDGNFSSSASTSESTTSETTTTRKSTTSKTTTRRKSTTSETTTTSPTSTTTDGDSSSSTTTRKSTTSETTTTAPMSSTTENSYDRNNGTYVDDDENDADNNSTLVDDHDDTQWARRVRKSIGGCPYGWLRYYDSCYHIELIKMDRESAQRACVEKGATLFVADSEEEFKEVVTQSPLYFWSWIGLSQYDSNYRPLWIGSTGMDPLRLKWLITPFSSIANGWSILATCAAFYNTESYHTSAYLYFYTCSTLYHSICERNMTLIPF